MKSVNISAKEVQSKYQNKLLALSEIVLVFTSVVGLMWITELLPGFESWQQAYLGEALFSATIYMALPVVLVLYFHGRAGSAIKLDGTAVKKGLKTGGKALLVMFPATFSFPIAQGWGYGFTDWGGAAIIGSFYLLATLAVLWILKSEDTTEETAFSRSDARIAGLVFLAALALVAGLHQLNAVARDVITALIFVGFMEELFFRGYLQPRLNMAFGKPFEFINLQFGWGIVITSVLFGLIHVISPGENPMEWSWGFWTFISGLGFGVIREKGGSFLAPAVVHGITMILPVVFS